MATKRKPPTTSGPPTKRTKLPSKDVPEDLEHGQSVRDLAKKHLILSAKFLVDDLTPEWTDSRNRELDPRQVNTLCKVFEERKLQRESEQHRLLVLCSGEEVRRMRAHVEQAGAAATSSPWLWFGDWAKVIGAPAELMAGQHRVAALKAFFAKKDRLTGSADPAPLWWVCDIYDRGRSPAPPPEPVADLSRHAAT
jgi:hypothetical protein